MSFSSFSTVSNYSNNVNKIIKNMIAIPNKLLYYDFESGIATDNFNTYTGILTGSCINTTRSKYGSYSFIGTSISASNYVAIPTNIPITTNGLSFSLWIYPTSTAAGGDIKVFEFNANEGIMLYTSASTTNYSWMYSPTFTILNNVWTHLILTINSSNQTSIYVNNVLVVSSSAANKYPTNSLIAQGKIGKSITSAHKPFTGSIDDFKIYNKILTVTEIDALFNNVAN